MITFGPVPDEKRTLAELTGEVRDLVRDVGCIHDRLQSLLTSLVTLDGSRVAAPVSNAAQDILRETNPSPTVSSQGESHSLRKDASDSEVGDVLVSDDTGLDHIAGSEEENTEEPQARNEPGSGGAVLAAASGGGETPPEARETAQSVSEPRSLGEIAKAIIERAKKKRARKPRIASDVVMGIDLSSEPSATVEAVLVGTEEGPVIESVRVVEETGISVDIKTATVTGPAGELRTTKSIARMVNHMADGLLYPFDVLAERSETYTRKEVGDALKIWKGSLATIGIEVFFYSRELVMLRRMEA